MKVAKVIFCFLLAVIFYTAPNVSASSMTIDPGTENENDLTSNWSTFNLFCRASDHLFYRSKVVFIRSTSAKFDYALTTAHGLEKGISDQFDTCYVRDSSGQPLKLITAYFAKGYKPGTSTDWAIIKLNKVDDKTVTRYKLHLPENSAFRNQENISVSFPKARGINDKFQLCSTLPSEFLGLANPKILSHDCRVIAGQSGSPILKQHDAEDVLIGVHLGKAFVYRSPISQKPEHLGYFRVIDQEMVHEINIAVRSFMQ